MVDIGYDSYNPILNLGTLFVMLMIYIGRIIFFWIVIKPLLRWNKITDKTYRQQKYLLYSYGVLIFVEGYIEFVITARLLVSAPSTSVDNNTMNWIITGIICFVCLGLMPYLYFVIWLTPENVLLLRKKFKSKWAALYHNLDPR